MRRLAGAHEHLDGALDRDQLAGNLRDLARVNRWLGGVSLSRAAIGALAIGPGRDPRSTLTVLDVGTGAADIPAALLREARGLRMRFVATDPRREIVDQARSLHGALTGLELQVADGRALPWPDGAFDIVHTSMVLHHQEPPDAMAMLRELARVARLGVVINDLDRGLVAWTTALVLLHVITRNGYTRHDGPLSVRRAYRPSEVVAMGASVGLREVRRFAGPGRHRYAIALASAR